VIKVDLHIHTEYSGDSLLSFEAIIATCQRRGIGCVAITDHNTIAGALAFKRIAPFPVIVGEEIRTTAGEITGLFLSQEIPRGLSPQETIDRIREQGGLVYIPHPFSRARRSSLRRDVLEEIVPQIDIVEAFNSRTLLGRDNERARRFAQEHGLPCGAGSDAHTAYEIGRAYVEMEEFSGEEDFLRNLAQGRVVGQLTVPLIHIITSLMKVYKKFGE